MIKKLLSVIVVLSTVFCVNTQAQELQKSKVNVRRAVPMMSDGMATSNIQLKEGEFWWGYFDGAYETVSNIGMGDNAKVPQFYSAATGFAAGTEELEGKTIEGIEFSFPSSEHVTDLRIWISNDLPATPEQATVCCQSVDECVGFNVKGDIVNQIRFDKPYKIDNTKDVYIGYAFNISSDESSNDTYPVFITGVDAHAKGLLVNVNPEASEYVDYEPYGFGDLAARFLLSGGNFEKNSVSIESEFPSVNGVKGSDVEIPLVVKNLGGNGFESLDLTVDINGTKQQVKVTPDEKVMGISTKYAFNLSVKAPEEMGNMPVTITVDKVNGEANLSKHNVCTGSIFVVSRLVTHKPVFEEFTATWCGFCPRGAVGMAKARQIYGDDIVLIAVHYEDEMSCKDYYNIIKSTVMGFPSSHIDRTLMDIDPYFGSAKGSVPFGVQQDIEKQMAVIPNAEIIADAVVDGDIVTAKSDVKFLYTGAADYAVAYVLTEDGIKNDDWWQGNNYSGAQGFEDEPLFDFWTKAGKQVYGVEYNEVAIAAQGLEGGVKGSIPANVTAEESNKYEVTFDLADYPGIMDKTKLNLCVLLIDQATGRIMNADCKALDSASGIDGITSDNDVKEVARYTVDGRQISVPEKGVNIVKYSDGQVRKIIVK